MSLERIKLKNRNGQGVCPSIWTQCASVHMDRGCVRPYGHGVRPSIWTGGVSVHMDRGCARPYA